jgi:hypothetical protein
VPTMTVAYPPKLVTADLLIQVRSNLKPRRTFGLEVRCPGNNALPAWGAACKALEHEPSVLSNNKVDPGCWGGMAMTQMRVRGTIGGRHIDLSQSGMCGPPGIIAWYELLKQYPALPSWLRPYVA